MFECGERDQGTSEDIITRARSVFQSMLISLAYMLRSAQIDVSRLHLEGRPLSHGGCIKEHELCTREFSTIECWKPSGGDIEDVY